MAVETGAGTGAHEVRIAVTDDLDLVTTEGSEKMPGAHGQTIEFRSEGCYARVKAVGANITMELTEQHYGGSLFGVRDPEGQLWHVGSYDPWAEASGAPEELGAFAGPRHPGRRTSRPSVPSACCQRSPPPTTTSPTPAKGTAPPL